MSIKRLIKKSFTQSPIPKIEATLKVFASGAYDISSGTYTKTVVETKIQVYFTQRKVQGSVNEYENIAITAFDVPSVTLDAALVINSHEYKISAIQVDSFSGLTSFKLT